ncbi:uncharacterized protein LOC143026954 [Oratosquilla oratoria]|uniref:uncharacterized protein LOC143026954 n=1 Tax=Oratosquilla oratoria TaxID=337810 RepID=UPI003F76C91A
MVIISDSDAEAFIALEPAVEEIERLSVAELRVVAALNGFDLSQKANKAGLVSVVCQQLGLETESSNESEMSNESQRRREETEGNVMVRRLELELEIRRVELRTEEIKASRSRSPQPSFVLDKAVRLVPPFSENHLDEFFASFERLAIRLEWPRHMWTVLLQQSFRGKALKAYMALPDDEALNYEAVKRQVLSAYSLVPETYRQRFRGYKKTPEISHLELARSKREAFLKWRRASAAESFDELVELILIEDFYLTIYKEVAIHLAEKDFRTLEEAAKMADKYVLARKDAYVHRPGSGLVSQSQSKGMSGPKRQAGPPSQGKDTSKLVPVGRSKNNIQCSYCKKSGHVEQYCWRKMQAGKAKSLMLSSKAPEPEVVPEEQVKSVGVVNSESISQSPDIGYKNFISVGEVTVGEVSKPVTVLRDSGALQTLIRAGIVEGEETGERVVLSSIGGLNSAPLVKVHVSTDCFKGVASVAVLPNLPTEGVDLILGNDLAGGKMGRDPSPILQLKPEGSLDLTKLEKAMPQLFSLCAVTRSMSATHPPPASPGPVKENTDAQPDDVVDIASLFTHNDSVLVSSSADKSISGRQALIAAQREDEELAPLLEEAGDGEEEARPTSTFYLREGVLCRRWLPPTYPKEDLTWASVEQVMVPTAYRKALLEVAHDGRFAGHLGVRKTFERLSRAFFWPGIRKDVSQHCKLCHVCQMAGASNKRIPPAPLVKIPHLQEPFAELQVDVVGPLDKTRKGNQYLLTMVDTATRYVEAVPMRSVTATTIVRHMMNFFAQFGVPCNVQTDGASYFTGKVFKDFSVSTGFQHKVASPYHPQTQGVVERSHQTLKGILRKYALVFQNSWDDNLHFVKFVLRDMPSESTGFSPFELIFAHQVRGPLCHIKQRLLESEHKEFSLLEYIGEMRQNLIKCWKIAAEHLDESQSRAKHWFDKKARYREFQPGDLVLVLLPFKGNVFQAKFQGPYRVIKRVGEVNYVVATPERRRKQWLCHINMLKDYAHTSGEPLGAPVCLTNPVNPAEVEGEVEVGPLPVSCAEAWGENTAARAVLETGLGHLNDEQKEELLAVMDKYPNVFKDRPGLATSVVHDIDVCNASPVKQSPYRVHPHKAPLIQKEIDAMLQMGLIRPGASEWCSPVLLVPKPDGGQRFCIDFRRINKITKKDSFPLPRIEDCIERIGSSNYLSKVDLLKGFWQIPLSSKAQEICCFSTLGQTYLPLVLPFGLCNSPSTFQRLMHSVLAGIDNVVVYLDDILVFTDTWQAHINQLDSLFNALHNNNLVVNLSKCIFAQAQVPYLGHIVGGGVLSPPSAKVEAISMMAVPNTKRQVRRFLGAVGYYRRYIKNFADITLPLTDLLKKNTPFKWSEPCEKSFQGLKQVLCSYPVLVAPDFGKSFKLACDASDGAIGGILLQENEQEIDHPVAYFSKKLTPAQKNYATVEKELLSIVLSLNHFSFYLPPSEEVKIYTDHRPLTYLESFKTKNQRLTRWSLYLQNFNLKVIHVRGLDNVLADMLSRPVSV